MTSEIIVGLDLQSEDAPRVGAIDFLILRGFAREAAESLIEQIGGPNVNEEISAWAERVFSKTHMGNTPEANDLKEHHVEGIPPFEPPARWTEEDETAGNAS
jgi:hypothetical protein